MTLVQTIILHQAFGQEWKQMDKYQGYVPEESTWAVALQTFSKKNHGINKPMLILLHKEGSPLQVKICEYKPKGERLPLSDKNSLVESSFVLCEILHSSEKIVIFV